MIGRGITIDELGGAINQLKLAKAVSEDLIANEFSKSSRYSMRLTICHLFNECLKIGAYPWNTSLVIQDPNNYRAIAVASNLGKLFCIFYDINSKTRELPSSLPTRHTKSSRIL